MISTQLVVAAESAFCTCWKERKVVKLVYLSLFSNSSLTSFFPFLNSLIPLPRPFISSGIFLPPNKSKIASALAILLLFGGKKIPELMKGLGKGISEFKKGKNEVKDELENKDK